MNQTSTIVRKFALCVVPALVVAGQVLAAPTFGTVLDAPSRIDNCASNAIKAGPPQWVLDRQQYETTYVYGDTVQAAAVESGEPAWAADRRQYETTYVYGDSVQAAAIQSGEPAWAADRQQYETTYVYTAPQGDMLSTDTVCTTDTEAAG